MVSIWMEILSNLAVNRFGKGLGAALQLFDDFWPYLLYGQRTDRSRPRLRVDLFDF